MLNLIFFNCSNDVVGISNSNGNSTNVLNIISPGLPIAGCPLFKRIIEIFIIYNSFKIIQNIKK